MTEVQAALSEFAPAKVNLNLRVLSRRLDGYHELESLVVFAEVGDRVSLTVGDRLGLRARGATASAAGPTESNLILKAAGALQERVPDLRVGRFDLRKRLPVAAGLGGGSADAAAALRLLAHANELPFDDRRLMDAARATGADVPVCVGGRARVMRGVGEQLSDPLDIGRLPAVLLNPGVPVATKDVFAALRLPQTRTSSLTESYLRRLSGPIAVDELIQLLVETGNDLEPPALTLQPAIADALSALRTAPGCQLARMSGSGATCFGLFGSFRAARAAARSLREQHPAWWVRATRLG